MFASARPRVLLAAIAIAITTVIVFGVVGSTRAEAADTFDDVGSDNTFYDDITWLAGVGVTKGCNPPSNTRFCPDGVVTRGQMAAFLTRALALPAAQGIDFIDDNGSVFEADIERMAAAGITKGCNPPANTRFCPDSVVTRGQMAAFLARALALPAAQGIDFSDDDGSVFEADIEKLAAAGITKGCNPPSNTRFCPDGKVTREQMAAFLHRALGDRLFVKTYLMDLTRVDGDRPSEGGVAVDGELYTKSIYWLDYSGYSGDEWTEYDLGRDFSQFCAAVGLRDDSDANLKLEVEVYVDGVSKWVRTIGLGETVPLKISVADGLRLRVASRSGSTASASGRIVFGDAHLQDNGECVVPAGVPTEKPNPQTFLVDLDRVDGDRPSEGGVEVNGELYTKSIYWLDYSGYSGDEWTEYDLSRDYNRLCAAVGLRDDSDANLKLEVEVYVDGVSKWVRTIGFAETHVLSVPVADGLRLRVASRSGSTASASGRIVFGNAYLSTGGCS